jgi:hypothetical protein
MEKKTAYRVQKRREERASGGSTVVGVYLVRHSKWTLYRLNDVKFVAVVALLEDGLVGVEFFLDHGPAQLGELFRL